MCGQHSGGGVHFVSVESVTLTSCSFSGNRVKVCVCLVWLEHVRAALHYQRCPLCCMLAAVQARRHTRCACTCSFVAHWSQHLLCELLSAAAMCIWMRVVQSMAVWQYHGGGIYLKETKSVTLTSCSFSENMGEVCICLALLEHVRAELATCHVPHGCHKQGNMPHACMHMLS